MLKAIADFIHTQAGWEIMLLSIAKTALGLSKTLLRHTIEKKNLLFEKMSKFHVERTGWIQHEGL